MNTKKVDYVNGKLFPMILKFSVPAAISLLITAIYNIVDRMFVGNFNGTSALAGLSVCFPLSFMMMAFALTCSAGGSTFFSLFSGQNEPEKGNRSFGNALVMVCGSEIALSVLLLLFPDFFLRIFGVTRTAYPYCLLPDCGSRVPVSGVVPAVLRFCPGFRQAGAGNVCHRAGGCDQYRAGCLVYYCV